MFESTETGRGAILFQCLYHCRVTKSLQEDQVLWGECLLNRALYWNDFQNMMVARKVGFTDPHLVEDAPITVKNDAVEHYRT